MLVLRGGGASYHDSLMTLLSLVYDSETRFGIFLGCEKFEVGGFMLCPWHLGRRFTMKVPIAYAIGLSLGTISGPS